MALIHLVYTSTASRYMNEDELLGLLEQSRHRNMRQQVTGMLLYAKGSFFQVLEGEASDVEEIYQAIENDERNYGNIVILKSGIDQRSFPDWSMGFTNLNKSTAEDLEGFTDFMTAETSELINNSNIIMTLLYKFKESS